MCKRDVHEREKQRKADRGGERNIPCATATLAGYSGGVNKNLDSALAVLQNSGATIVSKYLIAITSDVQQWKAGEHCPKPKSRREFHNTLGLHRNIR